MDNSRSAKCPRCGTENAPRYVTNLHDDSEQRGKVTAKIYTYTCQACRMSYTEEVKVPPRPDPVGTPRFHRERGPEMQSGGSWPELDRQPPRA